MDAVLRWVCVLRRLSGGLLRGGLDDDGGGGVAWRRQGGSRLSWGASCVSPRRFWKNSGLHARAVRTWEFGALFRRGLVSDSYLYSVWVLLCGVRNWFFWEMTSRGPTG